jgi:hypothetical protein
MLLKDTVAGKSQLSRKCGSLNVSQLYGPPKPITERALLFLSKTIKNEVI